MYIHFSKTYQSYPKLTHNRQADAHVGRAFPFLLSAGIKLMKNTQEESKKIPFYSELLSMQFVFSAAMIVVGLSMGNLHAMEHLCAARQATHQAGQPCATCCMNDLALARMRSENNRLRKKVDVLHHKEISMAFSTWLQDKSDINFQNVESAFQRYPIDFDALVLHQDVDGLEERNGGQLINELLRNDRLKGLAVARLVQSYRSKKCEVFRTLLEMFETDATVLDTIKGWIEMYPLDVDAYYYYGEQTCGNKIDSLKNDDLTNALKPMRATFAWWRKATAIGIVTVLLAGIGLLVWKSHASPKKDSGQERPDHVSSKVTLSSKVTFSSCENTRVAS